MYALNSVREVLRIEGLDVAVLSGRGNFAWLTAGGSSAVREATENGVAKLVVTSGEVFLVTDNIELPRLLAEELHGLEVVPVSYPWYEDVRHIIARIIGTRRAGSDNGETGADISNQLVEARSHLSPEAQAQFRVLGRSASMCVENVLRRIERGWTEREIAGEVQREAMRSGLRPDVVLVGVDSRVMSYRHTTVTDAVLERYAMVVFCGERHGLIANTTRFVCFGELATELRERHEKAAEILSYMNAATVPGRPFVEIWRRVVELYDQAGWPGEWELHHQGGLTGYAPREWLLTSRTPGAVAVGQSYAWNPSIAGAKSEDTILVTEGGPETLTLTDSWPALTVQVEGGTVSRAAVLER